MTYLRPLSRSGLVCVASRPPLSPQPEAGLAMPLVLLARRMDTGIPQVRAALLPCRLVFLFAVAKRLLQTA